MDAGARTGIIAVDMGGSFLKRGIVMPGEKDWPTLRATFRRSTMHDEESRTVIDDLVAALASAFADAAAEGIAVTGIGICSPGPFDWVRGISLMTHKFRTIWGVSLGDEIRNRLALAEGMPIRFMPDSCAFAAGEKAFGSAKHHERCIYITLGTGIGSAFSDGSRIFLLHPSIPPSGAFWNAPYRDGTVEDYVSKRAITTNYAKATGGRSDRHIDIDMIHAKARAGDIAAIRVFADLGRDLGAVIRLYGTGFKPHFIVIGGGLAPCLPLFAYHMREAMGVMPGLEGFAASVLGDYGPLLGIEIGFKEGFHIG